MRRKSQKTTIGFIAVFVLAFVLALLSVIYLPIPKEFKKLAFFLMIPALSAIGVLVISKLSKRNRRGGF